MTTDQHCRCSHPRDRHTAAGSCQRWEVGCLCLHYTANWPTLEGRAAYEAIAHRAYIRAQAEIVTQVGSVAAPTSGRERWLLQVGARAGVVEALNQSRPPVVDASPPTLSSDLWIGT